MSTATNGSPHGKAEQRLANLVKEGLESPEMAADRAFWRRRREALRRAIAKREKLSS